LGHDIAWTNRFNTKYWIGLPHINVKEGLDFLYQLTLDPLIKEDQVEKEKGESVRVLEKNFKIQVIEFKSQKRVDELNVGSLIETGDLVTYAYYGPASSEGESLYIYIQHKDGTLREVKVNINNQ